MPCKLKLNIVLALSSFLILASPACSQPDAVQTSPIEIIQPLASPSDATEVQVVVHTENPGIPIPSEFLGLSYDDPLLTGDYFDEGNRQYINLLKNLGNGILCFGANNVEYTYWPRSFFSRFKFRNARAVLGSSDIDRMFAFAKKTGWRVIFGLNLGANEPKMAADLAAYTAGVGKDSLLAFEIGNEPDLFYRNGLRSPNYAYSNYIQEFNTYLQAIRERVPDAPIAGPVTASKFSWFSSFLKDEASNIVLATNHHYPLDAGSSVSPTDPIYASIENLLSAATTQRSSDLARQYANSSQTYHIPLRFDESNSSYPPKDGLGNTFAAALWGTDYLFNLVERGLTGVNFFGGFECHGYTPICSEKGFLGFNVRYHAQPLYYAMLLFHDAAQGRIVPIDINTTLNVTAHATLGNDDRLRAIIINKEASQAITVQIDYGASFNQISAFRLIAGSLDAQDGVTFAGGSVNPDGTWFPRQAEQIQPEGATCQVVVPAASAVEIVFSN